MIASLIYLIVVIQGKKIPNLRDCGTSADALSLQYQI